MPYAGEFLHNLFNSYLQTPQERKFYKPAVAIVTILFVLNGGIAAYFCAVHQRGTMDVMAHLQAQPSRELKSALFLMPCHSTPFFSHIHRKLDMRILNCDPRYPNKSPSMPESDSSFFFGQFRLSAQNR